MPLRLSEAQWTHILAESGVLDGQKPRPRPLAQKSNEVVFVLALEGDKPKADWKWWEKTLDTLVQTVQPAPALTHVEVLLPPTPEGDEVHFATYLGKAANWGSGFGDSETFYLDPNGNGPSWRAIPVMARGATERLRAACEAQRGAPYGAPYRLFNYPFSFPPLRSLAGWLDDSPGAPAHCSALTARCLRRGLPELDLSHPAAWYGPSTLFLELTRRARMESYGRHLAEMATLPSLAEQEEAGKGSEVLLRGSDESVRALTHAEATAGVQLLCGRCIDAIVEEDATMERLTQKQLARALLRWSLVGQKGGRGPSPPPTGGAAPSSVSGGMFRHV